MSSRSGRSLAWDKALAERQNRARPALNMPKATGEACPVCQIFPLVVERRAMAARIKRQLKKETDPEECRKLRRILRGFKGSGPCEIHLHSKTKDTPSVLQMLSTVPGVTRANWKLVRDELLYGPIVRPQGGPGSFLHHLAEWCCSRRTMTLVVMPWLCDLRVELEGARGARRPAKVVWLRIESCWSLLKSIVLATVRQTLRNQ
jgi:hypothetical protein